jgi:hypothetical protein
MKFESGKVHKTFQTKDGRMCSLRWASDADLEQLTNFINEIAAEDTFVPYSPTDRETLETEAVWLKGTSELRAPMGMKVILWLKLMAKSLVLQK